MTTPDRFGLQRIIPALPVTAMKTYQAVSPQALLPKSTTACERAGCQAYLSGWKTTVDERTDLGQSQAHYIRNDRSRRHSERRTDAGLTEFAFDAGQRCFAQHRLPREGDERFIVRGGDWRGFTSEPRVLPAQSWLDDFGEHQERLADRLGEG